MLDEKNGYGLAILAVGAALVVLFAAAGLIGAFGTSIPQELWAEAGALSGALVGLFLPAPKTPPTPVAVAASAASAVSVVHRAALRAAVAKGQTIIDGDPAQSGAVQAAIAEVKRTTEGRVSGPAADPITNAVAQHLAAVNADPKKHQQVMQAAADGAEAATEALSQQSFVGGVPSWLTWFASALGQILNPRNHHLHRAEAWDPALGRSRPLHRVCGSQAGLQQRRGSLRYRVVSSGNSHDYLRFHSWRCIDRALRA